MIRLSGYIDVPEARRAAIEAALPFHVAATRAEAGCLDFQVAPDPATPGRYRVEERFTDRAAFEAHQARARASEWGRLSAGIARHYEVTET